MLLKGLVQRSSFPSCPQLLCVSCMQLGLKHDVRLRRPFSPPSLPPPLSLFPVNRFTCQELEVPVPCPHPQVSAKGMPCSVLGSPSGLWDTGGQTPAVRAVQCSLLFPRAYESKRLMVMGTCGSHVLQSEASQARTGSPRAGTLLVTLVSVRPDGSQPTSSPSNEKKISIPVVRPR